MQIVNFKHYGSIAALDENFANWVYVGRESRKYGLHQSPLANPYSIRQAGSRENAIELYRSWLWLQIRHKNPRILNALRDIQDDSVLVCWCHPLPCHAEVILKARNYLLKAGLL